MKRSTSVLWAACLGYSMVILDTTVLNVALPTIARDTTASAGQQQWIIDAYVLVMTALLLAGGGLIDRFGATRIFKIGVAVFGAASVVCATTTAAPVLITARALQGVGGAMLIPATLAVVLSYFTVPQERGRAIAIIATVTASPQAFGPSLGGLLVDTLGWRSIFLLNVPVGIITLFFARGLPAGLSHKRPLDLAGLLLVVVALGSVTFGAIDLTNGHPAPFMAALAFIIAITAGILFALVETRVKSPLLPSQVLRAPVVQLYVLAGMFLFMLFYGALFAANLYFQQALGLNAISSGLLLLPAGIPVFVLPIVVSKLTSKRGPAAVTMTGAIVATFGAAVALCSGLDSSPLVISGSLLIVGIGFGIASPPHLALATSIAPAGTGGVISALANAGRQSGYLFGVALVGMAGSGLIGFQVASGITVIAGLLALSALILARRIQSSAKPLRTLSLID